MHRGGIRRSRGEGGYRGRRTGGHGNDRSRERRTHGHDSESGRGRRGGGGRHPSGLSGKEIGLWYARRGKDKKKKIEIQQRAVVTMTRQKEERISNLLDQLRGDEIADDASHPNRNWRSDQQHRYFRSSSSSSSSSRDSNTKSSAWNNDDEPCTSSQSRYQYRHTSSLGEEQPDGACYSRERVEGTSSLVTVAAPRLWHDNATVQSCATQIKHEGKEQLASLHLAGHRDNQKPRFGASSSISGVECGDHRSDSTAGTSKRWWEENITENWDTRGDEVMQYEDNTPSQVATCGDECTGWPTKQAAISSLVPGSSTAPSHDPSSQLTRDICLDKKLQENLVSRQTDCSKLQEFRKTLPSYKMKEELVELIKYNQVVVISGETGCGKTTQVAQFLLDDAIDSGNGSICRIVCTQPRRISAISVAERVAKERGERCGEGNSVGFQIRLESKLPRSQGSILYCTTGIMLRWLVSDPLLRSTSHIILDEIHERDLLSDFLIIIVRDLLPLRPDLKLILMSATLNAEMFSEYFGNCPMVNIPGFTYPVKEIYLEESIEMTRYSVSTQTNQDGRRGYHGNPRGRRKSWAKDRRLQKGMSWLEESEEDLFADEEFQWKQYLDVIRPRFSWRTVETLENMNFDKIDFDLVVKVITHISLNMEDGAILCFLPGWDDITKLYDSLKGSRVFSSEKFLIIPLHSMLPTSNQQQVFDKPPPGTRKIVIATNIAETSITIDDVVFVVDCGKVKEKTYDAGNKIACLQPVWISKASSKQRRGRAGRVRPGYCFHLFTEFRYNLLKEYQLPEMLRTPLEELCLQIKILKLGMIEPFLLKSLQPPSSQAVANALEVLTQLSLRSGECLHGLSTSNSLQLEKTGGAKALDNNEELTPLGYHLATLPVDPRIGKMILFGAIFSCLDPVLTVSSSLGFKEPFVCPLHKQKQTDEAKAKFAGNTRSDHLTLLKAFEGWEKAKRHGNEGDYCWRNFLSSSTLKMISNMKEQFTRLLSDIGFLGNPNPKAREANLFSDNAKLIKAVLCAGLYPNVAKIEHHLKLKRPPKFFTQQDGKVALHPRSVNSEVVMYEDNWLIYHHKMKSTKVFIHDCTMIAPYPLLFFGGDISVFQEEGQDTIAVDDFIKFKSPTRIANLVKELRSALDRLLEQKIAQPEMKLSVGRDTADKGSQLLHAIIDLITSEQVTSKGKTKSR